MKYFSVEKFNHLAGGRNPVKKNLVHSENVYDFLIKIAPKV